MVFTFVVVEHNMRCQAPRISEIIRSRYHRDPFNGDVYIFMSKDLRKVKMIHFENHAYYLHEKSFTDGYRFIRLEFKIVCLFKYREMTRMAEMKMSISCQTLINWYGKIAAKLTILVPALKDEALCENANVNVDETWCRYQTLFGHKKHYNPIIETCKLLVISARDYISRFLNLKKSH